MADPRNPDEKRAAVLRALGCGRSMLMSELMSATGYTGGTIRQHLDRLVAEGVVEIRPLSQPAVAGNRAGKYVWRLKEKTDA